jgi:glucokinase
MQESNKSHMTPRYLGIEIGGTKLQLVIGDGQGTIAERFRFAVEREKGAEAIRKRIAETVATVCGSNAMAAIGVGFGGPVNWKTGQICCSHHVKGWSDFPIGQWLQDMAGVPVAVDNDANVASLAEASCGAGRGKNPVFYVTLGSGVGGGLVANGEIYHGAHPGEGEIGHVRLSRSGLIIESRCSGWAVDAKVRAAIKDHPQSELALCAAGMTANQAKALVPALAKGDPIARKILEDTAADLAFGLSHASHLFHPEVIVLGGGLSLIGEPLRDAVQTPLRRWIMKAHAPGPEVLLAQLGEDVVPVGALILAGKTARPV